MKERILRKEEYIPLQKKAADLFILASRKHAASITLQGAEIARICKKNNYHPTDLKHALQRDPMQLERIKELADYQHDKQNNPERDLVAQGVKDGIEAKYIAPIDDKDVQDIIHTTYYWAERLYELPSYDIQSLMEYSIDMTLPIGKKEDIRVEFIRKKLKELKTKKD